MDYIVLDFEFNQAFDFKNNCAAPHIKECRFEIIQIGAVKLNENFKIVDKFDTYIKPNLYKKIHPHVKKVTSITDEMLQDKNDFKKEILKFFEFLGNENEHIFCTWGSNDILTLYKNLKYYNFIKNDKILLKYIDIQSITTSYLKYNKGSSIGLKSATELLEISANDDFHNALNDAIYTAKIFQKLSNQNFSIKVFNSKYV